jgi:hypothetical protein
VKITDTARIEWLTKRLDYLEHSDVNGLSAHKQPPNRGFWPITDDAEEDGYYITLVEYIDMMIMEEVSGDPAGQPTF